MIVALLISSVLIGVLLGKFFGEKQKFAKSLLVVSAGFLITICLNEVFPEIYVADQRNIGIWVIGGVLLQMLLENLTKGFEHGHFHHHTEGKNILPFALMVGLFIHAFLEGIPLSNQDSVLTPYLTGILVHNIPISFILGAFLVKNKKFSPSAVLIISLFALASPCGFLLGQYFNPDLEVYFLALVGGIFLHISSVIIFESNKNHNVDWQKLGLVLLGVVLAMTGHLFHSH
ncbi:ZIP family metal transporter [Kaistella palustris]|uniref:ZIP family metal transporter n=1 Tax=Kaistella palustris TaxID=493376 RepID=UPI00040983C0|nr:ZIP family metal transporter [Kaistella palustris]